MNSNKEPVAIGGSIQAFFAAFIALALIFEWIAWTVEQVGAVMAVYTAGSILVTAVQRSRVTPV